MDSKTKILVGVLIVVLLVGGWWALSQKNAGNKEINTDKIDSYLKYLMNSKGLQEEYLVDIEFSSELSNGDVKELESNYHLTFTRLPDGSIAHTGQYYGALVDGYTINLMTKRLNVIRLSSALQTVQVPP